MTDRDRWGLRGPVRTCIVTRTLYSRQCRAEACETEQRGGTAECEFRTDGSLARHRHRNHDGSEWISNYEYDRQDRLVAIRTGNGSGPAGDRIHEYDQDGRLVQVIARAPDGRDRLAETYMYDAIGRKQKTVHVDVAELQPNTDYMWGVEGSDSAYTARGAATVITIYGGTDRPMEMRFHDKTGRLLSRVELRYDENGNLAEEAHSTIVDGLAPDMLAGLNAAQIQTMLALVGDSGPHRRHHRYDAQGRRIETYGEFGPIGRDRKIVAYNEHGDISEEINEHEMREHALDEDGRLTPVPGSEKLIRSEARFHYQHDARGNWMRKMGESRPASDQEFAGFSVEERTITYYGEGA